MVKSKRHPYRKHYSWSNIHPIGTIISIWETAASILPNNIVFSECTVKGIFAYRVIFPAVRELLTQGYFPEKFVTQRISLSKL